MSSSLTLLLFTQHIFLGSYLFFFWQDLTEYVSSLYSWGSHGNDEVSLKRWISLCMPFLAWVFFHFLLLFGRSLTSNNFSVSTSVFLSKRYHLQPEPVRGIPMIFFFFGGSEVDFSFIVLVSIFLIRPRFWGCGSNFNFFLGPLHSSVSVSVLLSAAFCRFPIALFQPHGFDKPWRFMCCIATDGEYFSS